MANEQQSVTTILNQQVANWSLLYVKLHHFHWFVTGPHFYELHLKFETLYQEAALHVDQLAERILALGEKPLGSMKDFLTAATINEAQGNESPQQMVEALTHDYEVILNQLRDGIDLANQEADDVSVDLLTGIQVQVEKHLWMFHAFLA